MDVLSDRLRHHGSHIDVTVYLLPHHLLRHRLPYLLRPILNNLQVLNDQLGCAGCYASRSVQRPNNCCNLKTFSLLWTNKIFLFSPPTTATPLMINLFAFLLTDSQSAFLSLLAPRFRWEEIAGQDQDGLPAEAEQQLAIFVVSLGTIAMVEKIGFFIFMP
jgi:hypothetical protein